MTHYWKAIAYRNRTTILHQSHSHSWLHQSHIDDLGIRGYHSLVNKMETAIKWKIRNQSEFCKRHRNHNEKLI
jgi:hypothetical protein